MQSQWFLAVVTKYHRIKFRHRIDYDDGDHEWINIEKEKDRVQVELEDGGWVMYQMFRPPDMVSDWEKRKQRREHEDFKALAWKDAQQWRALADSSREKILFISDTTGEMRTGHEDAMSWVIQDDGFGLPTFYNARTGGMSAEDPRFEDDPDTDVNRRRHFALHELRYMSYFCQEYWNQYTTALKMQDDRAVHTVMKQVNKSNKPKLLAAILVQVKGLYEVISVVDKLMDADLIKVNIA